MRDPDLHVKCLSKLHEALGQPNGVLVRTNNPTALQAALYKVKKDDPLFASLSITLSPTDPENELWIYANGKT